MSPPAARARRQVVSGALAHHEVDADAERRAEREHRAEQVEAGTRDIDDEHESHDRDDGPGHYEARGRSPGAHPDEADQHDRSEVLDQERHGDGHPLHGGEEEQLTAQHRDESERDERQRMAAEELALAPSARTSAGEDERGEPHPHDERRRERPPRPSSGLTSGPLEEKARAETTAMTIPVVRADEAVRTPAVLGFECAVMTEQRIHW
jgi:hypothetical protein